jgi:hypothetical protein
MAQPGAIQTDGSSQIFVDRTVDTVSTVIQPLPIRHGCGCRGTPEDRKRLWELNRRRQEKK